MSPARLAWANTKHEAKRTLVSVVGAAFAVLLIFMQLGFLGATQATATVLYGKLRYDLVVYSGEYLDFSRPGSIDRARLTGALSVEGVGRVVPLTTGQGLWRTPVGEFTGRRLAISVLAVAPRDLQDVFTPDCFPEGGVGLAGRRLARTGAVLLDEKSRPDFGRPPAGTFVEFNQQRVEFAGYFRVGTGFSYTGLLLVSEETFARTTARPTRETTFGLVTCPPGTDLEAVKRRLESALGPDVRVATRVEFESRERDYWVNKTAIGQLFYFGVLLAFTVGAIFVYQMIAADIKKQLPGYATLKAVGYPSGFLFQIVVWQSLFLAVGGYAIGLAAAVVCYQLTTIASGLPMRLSPDITLTVAGFTLLMCVGSALVAVRKVRRADPADLF